MDNVILLTGTTRGQTLERIGRSVGKQFQALGLECHEIALLEDPNPLARLSKIPLGSTRFILSWAGMGLSIDIVSEDGPKQNLWRLLGIPFITLHGDSPAYYFDRHVMQSSLFTSVYPFVEHAAFRRRLPNMRGMVQTIWPAVLDPIAEDELDWQAKKQAKLVFLKNGKDPAALRSYWPQVLTGRALLILKELAVELEGRLDDPATQQLDDLVCARLEQEGLDLQPLLRFRLFLVAQLDDYLRALKCSLMVEALRDFPVELIGNNWSHLDLSGGRLQYIDECDYSKSVGHVRNALGVIDMSPNTGSRPHDRVVRAFGANTLCVTNRQSFLEELPHGDRISFQFTKESIQETVSALLAHPGRSLEWGQEIAAAYQQQHPAHETLRPLLDWASVSRADSLTQLPPGCQDYLIWPPTLA